MMGFSLNAGILGLSALSQTPLWQPAELFGITSYSIQSSSTSLNPLNSVSNLPHPPADNRHPAPPYNFSFFFLTYEKFLLVFPSLLCSTPHILEVTFRPHWQCYLYCPGLGSCYSFPLLTEDVCSDLNFTKVQGCLESGLLAWTPLSASCQHLGVDRSCLQLRQPDLQDANDQE